MRARARPGWLGAAVIAALLGCGSARSPEPVSAPEPHAPEPTSTPEKVEAVEAEPRGGPAGKAVQRGGASYYADYFEGRKTASGEPYRAVAMTAAHRNLPFGTVVEVRRKDGRSVRVRINDRGPFVKGRIIDLSRRAAERLDMIRAGVVDVTLHIVSRPPPKAKKPSRKRNKKKRSRR